MGKLKTREKMPKVHEEKVDARKQNNFDLNYIREGIKKVINNHLKSDEKHPDNNSKAKELGKLIDEYGQKELETLISLLLGETTMAEQEEKYKQGLKNLMSLYDEALNDYNRMIALDNSIKDTRTDLLQLKADISLGKHLDIL